MALSDARKKANQKYIGKLDEIKIRAEKGTKERWKAEAEQREQSLNQMVIEAVEKHIAKK